MTNVLIRRVIDGDEDVVAAKVSIVLVDEDGVQRVGWQVSTNKTITEYQGLTLDSDSGDLTLALIPQDDIAIDADASPTYYRVMVSVSERLEAWDVQVPDSVVTQELVDLVGAAAVDPGSLIGNLLIKDRDVLGSQSTTVTWDWTDGPCGFTVTLTGNATVAAPTNPETLPSGSFTEGLITITQDNTGSRVPTWNSVWKNAPTLHGGQVVADAVVDIALVYDGTDYVLGYPVTR